MKEYPVVYTVKGRDVFPSGDMLDLQQGGTLIVVRPQPILIADPLTPPTSDPGKVRMTLVRTYSMFQVISWGYETDQEEISL